MTSKTSCGGSSSFTSSFSTAGDGSEGRCPWRPVDLHKISSYIAKAISCLFFSFLPQITAGATPPLMAKHLQLRYARSVPILSKPLINCLKWNLHVFNLEFHLDFL
eukprot:GHVN01074494.1.p1 GENE.GHVN01074494.1~~GHVN01074494.1.p1  ORF type:complete len:106 (+),score=4.59 GHVN01074494.1:457-774(+)